MKITPEIATQIVRMHERDKIKVKDIAARFDVSNAHVYRVLNDKQSYLNGRCLTILQKIPQWKKDEIISMHKIGLSYPKISAITKVKRFHIRKTLNEAGIKLCFGYQGTRLTKTHISEIIKLRKEGLSLKKIGNKYGVSDMAVMYHLRKQDVK